MTTYTGVIANPTSGPSAGTDPKQESPIRFLQAGGLHHKCDEVWRGSGGIGRLRDRLSFRQAVRYPLQFRICLKDIPRVSLFS